MSEMNKELVSLGKIEEAKMLTQEEIDNRIINKIEDMKYGYLELGGYLKTSKEIYFRDTIDIYNKLKGTNIKYEAETDIVKKLKNFAKKYNSIVHLVAHPRKSMNDEIEKDDVAGSANITNLADYVTTISRAKDEEIEYDAILKILKNRHTGVNVGKKLMFSIERKRFYSAETEKELNKRYLDLWEEVQGTWED